MLFIIDDIIDFVSDVIMGNDCFLRTVLVLILITVRRIASFVMF